MKGQQRTHLFSGVQEDELYKYAELACGTNFRFSRAIEDADGVRVLRIDNKITDNKDNVTCRNCQRAIRLSEVRR